MPERLAVAPFENLSDDAGLGWAGWALAEMISTQVSGAPGLRVVWTGDAREAAAHGATSVVRGYYSCAGGKLRVNAVRQDLRTNRTVAEFSTVEPFPDSLLRAGDALSKWIWPGAGRFETSSVEALRALAEGRAAENPAEAEAAFARAASADAGFGGAYVAWARSLMARGDRAGVERLFAQAQPHLAGFSQLRRLELELLAATAAGDAGRRRKALEEISRATPAGADVFRQLAAEAYRARRFDEAAASFRRALELEPADAASWNQLGYTEALRGNLAEAREALTRYQRLAPGDANPLDSLGDVHYHLGAFAEAEKYYLQAVEKNRLFLGGADLYKAARARLMTGDVAGADGLYRRNLDGRNPAQDPLAAYREAQWLYLSGRRDEGRARMSTVAGGSAVADVKSLAAAQLAVWSLETGGADARAWTAKAVETASSPVARQLAAMCLIASGAQAPGGVLPPLLERRAAAYRLLLSRRFAEAVPVLREVAGAAAPASAVWVAVLWGGARAETGKAAEAAPLVAANPIPSPGMEDAFFALSFPRAIQLRAAALASPGKQREAASAMELFRKLGGR